MFQEKYFIPRLFVVMSLLLSVMLAPARAVAQNVVYKACDSIRVEELVNVHHRKSYASRGEQVLGIANDFVGERYVGNTLDREGEPLFVSTTELDCTTFVELVIAIASARDNDGFDAVCRNLERIRYWGGVRNGYASRLHYISWWIDDAERKGLMEEIVTDHHTASHVLELNFMSRHPGSYAQLKDDPLMTNKIAELEKLFNGAEIKYVPKDAVGMLDGHDIRNGDIISLVTSVEGLDVSHVGFACWCNGELFMIHASSAKGMVLCDIVPLTVYLSERRMNLGIRIFRVL